MFYLLSWAAFGLITGLVSKYLHPGEDPVGFLPTVGIGIAGSFIGGAIQWVMNMGGPLQPAGLAWSVLGGVIFCYAYRRFRLDRFIKAQGRLPNKK